MGGSVGCGLPTVRLWRGGEARVRMLARGENFRTHNFLPKVPTLQLRRRHHETAAAGEMNTSRVCLPAFVSSRPKRPWSLSCRVSAQSIPEMPLFNFTTYIEGRATTAFQVSSTPQPTSIGTVLLKAKLKKRKRRELQLPAGRYVPATTPN